ncbi:MAG: hypothetical protein KatS3mg112_0618 [Thermogutta sp.]|nr:MAG: hypothetical protein KatS3mg112_0618 [Thermogutta sp.]
MVRPWCVVGGITIAGCLLLVLLLAAVKACRPHGCVLRHSLWSAGTISNPSGNDIWIEYGAGNSQRCGDLPGLRCRWIC